MSKKTNTETNVTHISKTNTLGSLRSFLDPKSLVYVHFTSKSWIDSSDIKKLDKDIERRLSQICQFMNVNSGYNNETILLMYNRIVFHEYMIKSIIVLVVYIPDEEDK